MSLRTDIQDVVNQVTPPAPGLESQVRTLIVADGKRRSVSLHSQRRSAWAGGFRRTGALVAAALVFTLVVGLVIGVRLARDVGNGQLSQASSISQSELRGLESRPNVLPRLRPGAACPYSLGTSEVHDLHLKGAVIGQGPVYAYGAWKVGTTGQGDWTAFAFYYVAERPGLVLVRAGDLATNQPFVFAQDRQSAAIATGRVVGTDRLLGKTIQIYPEAVLLDPWHREGANEQLVVMFAIPRATLCWGFQFDGPGFTQTIVDGWDTPANKGLVG
ncbi:MAG TPA: hypothetical protein VGX27_11195 [Candidatus Dormibacteraeota bacterium]|nr:hypothetical protein [Candidatus Dormibacteraeota bacterium]